MTHTPIMKHARRALASARSSLGLPPRTRTALSRRQALLLLAAGAATACTTHPAGAAPQAGRSSVAIIGGGVAGLTVAFRIARAGRAATIYEASNRFGGRMFTRRNFTPEGQFCELGGELVDTDHLALRKLASEVGVAVDPIDGADAPGVEAYWFGGVLRSSRDLIDPDGSGGDFRRLAQRIAVDQEALTDSDGEWTARARELDRTSLADYLASARDVAPAWVIDFLLIAYESEYGLPPSQQSALNLVDLISTDTDDEFAVYGDSDEAFRIRGGSSSLTDQLETWLRGPFGDRIRLRQGHALKAIRTGGPGDGLELAFAAPGGETRIEAEQVVLALPFTRLRQVEGVDAIGLSPEKLAAIRELGYGVNSKVMVPANGRPWRKGAGNVKQPLAAIYTDAGFQLAWDTSRGQPGPLGILTNFLTGEPALGTQEAAIGTLARGLGGISPEIGAKLLPAGAVSFFWPRHPFTLGSYSAPKVGQYTTLIESIAVPELDGRLHFAGEHASADYLGFMNGAIESAERVAADLLKAPAASIR